MRTFRPRLTKEAGRRPKPASEPSQQLNPLFSQTHCSAAGQSSYYQFAWKVGESIVVGGNGLPMSGFTPPIGRCRAGRHLLYLPVAGPTAVGKRGGGWETDRPWGPSPKRSLVPHPPLAPNPNSRQGYEPVLQGWVTMSKTVAMPSYVGIDVSKSRLDVHVRPDGTAFSFARDTITLADLVERLLSLLPTLVVLEATGGFEVTVAAALAGAALPLAIVNPRQMCDFARACGNLRRPMPSMPRRSLCSLNVSSRKSGSCLTNRLELWPIWSRADGRWLR